MYRLKKVGRYRDKNQHLVVSIVGIKVQTMYQQREKFSCVYLLHTSFGNMALSDGVKTLFQKLPVQIKYLHQRKMKLTSDIVKPLVELIDRWFDVPRMLENTAERASAGKGLERFKWGESGERQEK